MGKRELIQAFLQHRSNDIAAVKALLHGRPPSDHLMKQSKQPKNTLKSKEETGYET